jgi:hypothetical protein
VSRSSRWLQTLALALVALLPLERGHCALMRVPAPAAQPAAALPEGHGCCEGPAAPRPRDPGAGCPCIDLPSGPISQLVTVTPVSSHSAPIGVHATSESAPALASEAIPAVDWAQIPPPPRDATTSPRSPPFVA